MKILWVPQLSFVRDGIYQTDCDSNWNFLSNIISGITKISDHEIFLILPDKCQITESMKKILDKVNVINIHKTPDVFGTRFDFNFDNNKKIIEEIQPDIIFENDPTHVRAWKTILFGSNKDTKVITYFHWIDTPLMPKVPQEISYWLRQVDGALAADIVYFNSIYGINQFFESVKMTLKDDYYDSEVLYFKLRHFPPAMDKELVKYRKQKKEEASILFSHRVSVYAMYKDNIDFFVEAMERFKTKYEYSPKVYFTNPSRKEVPNFPFEYESLELELDDYYKFIGSEEVNIAPNFFLTSKNQWTISSIEASYLGNAVMMPNMFGYAEILPKEYNGYFDTFEEGYHVFEQTILNRSLREQLVKEFNENIDYLWDYNVAKTFLDSLDFIL